MFKVFIQGVFLVALFFCTWLALRTVNWVTIFKIEHLTNATEEKLGDMYWEMIKTGEEEIQDKKLTLALDSIMSDICKYNNIDKNTYKLHIIKSEEVNAFALPNKHIVINSSLILSAENEAELNGVICHEIAHVELNHIMKRLIKEVGLSALISVATGNNNTQLIKETIKLLSSTSYDRSLENEADNKAVEYLKKSNINPEPFANFLFRLAENEPNSMKYSSWISTHPDSKERAENIINQIEKENKYSKTILNVCTWNDLKNVLAESHKFTPLSNPIYN